MTKRKTYIIILKYLSLGKKMCANEIKQSFTKIVQINGVVTIPHEIRKVNKIEIGDYVTLLLLKVDKGEGLKMDEVEEKTK